MKTSKRLLSMLLVIAMILTFIPMSVFAATDYTVNVYLKDEAGGIPIGVKFNLEVYDGNSWQPVTTETIFENVGEYYKVSYTDSTGNVNDQKAFKISVDETTLPLDNSYEINYYEDVTYSSERTDGNEFTLVGGAAATKIYAKYEPKYKLTYDANHILLDDNTKTETEKYTLGEIVPVKSSSVLNMDDIRPYYFTGWNTERDGSGTAYYYNDQLTTENQVLV